MYNQGLIKEALLISIAIFFLVQAGVDIDSLIDPEFWRQAVVELREVLVQFWEFLKAKFT